MSLSKFLAKKGKPMPRMESAHGKQSKPMDEDEDLHPRMGMKVGAGMEHLNYGARDELASKHGSPDHGHFMEDLDMDEHGGDDGDEIDHLLGQVKRHIARMKG